MLDIQQQIINYNKTARNSKPIYIVIHDTGDSGATAQNEHDYFAGGDRQASADFFVDSNNIIQIIDTDVNYSWHCGDGRGVYGITNANSLGIEMCIESNGIPSDATIQNTLDLVKSLMDKYNIDVDHVVRHYDASRKDCPHSFDADNWAKWTEFKQRLQNSIIVLGWNKNSSGWWYCTDVANKYYYKDSWQYIENQWYSFDSDGYARCQCWIQDGGNYYYLKDNCMMAKSEWIQYNSNWYYLQADGKMATGWLNDGGKYYLLYSDGSMVHDCDLYGWSFDNSGVGTKIS
ncbi:N-acetylmuramoyl-L-alanine amidase [Clostridium sp. BL-8]|uniref:peptidoglycan recognition protein family protein n=1 Tax=Clostridium sp. BL-8 TaxID=349938 RepID=UPI0009C90E21|nr:N-acetylmuramoyl-L-alanine amidase [Clostridium sp. BL-8]OOM76562.1 autolysin [Clostridium sp. BL-8]